MIRIHRGPTPVSLRSLEIEIEKERMKEYHALPLIMRKHSKYPGKKSFFEGDVKEQLIREFHGKCAYCETRMFTSDVVNVVHFRPTSGTYFSEKAYSREHYWWLTFEWGNLYYACQICESNKRNHFPISGKPARVGKIEAELQREKRLLLDPCNDNPEEELTFDETGRVLSKTARGKRTITLLALNRSQLVAAREKELRNLQSICSHFSYLLAQNKTLDPHETHDHQLAEYIHIFENAVAPFSQFCAMKRQFMRKWMEGHPEVTSYLSSKYAEHLKDTPLISHNEQRQSQEALEDFETSTENYNLEDQENLQNYYLKHHQITRVVISNFKSIGELELEFPEQEGAEAPWLMLLGENGTGKSTILQAIALTLMGDKYRETFKKKDASTYLKKDTDFGYVQVYLSGYKSPFEILFETTSADFTVEHDPQQKVLLLGYGPTRLLPNETHKSPPESIARMENLFNPFSPLVDAKEFLYNLGDEDFHYVRSALESLLVLQEGDFIAKGQNPTEILITTNGVTVDLDELSDGYQSVIALTTDIMMTMKGIWRDSQDARGIVFLDEIDSHLHPRWKIQIVSRLRETFPNIQFVVTTHDPLCLRGLKNQEIRVLKRNANKEVIVFDDLPATDGYEIDQILTSSYFGLSSTASPQFDQWLEEYYKLLVVPEPQRSDEQQQQLARIKAELDKYELLGKTPREQAVFKIIDEFNAHTKDEGPLDLHEMDQATKDEILGILQSFDFMEESK